MMTLSYINQKNCQQIMLEREPTRNPPALVAFEKIRFPLQGGDGRGDYFQLLPGDVYRIFERKRPHQISVRERARPHWSFGSEQDARPTLSFHVVLACALKLRLTCRGNGRIREEKAEVEKHA